MNAHAVEECKFKMHKLLLEEFREGLWSRENYRVEIKKLGAPNPAPAQSASPLWGIEDGDSLPADDDGLDI